MNLARLQDIYHNIDIADKVDIDNIRQLTQDYPFYWMPYVILAKYYFQTGHYKFEDTLRQAAVRVYDRRSLYDYIHGRKKHVEVVVEQPPVEVREALTPLESNEAGIGEIANIPEMVLQEEPLVEQESQLIAEETYHKPGISEFLDNFAAEEEKPTEFVFEGKHEPRELDSINIDQDIIGEEIETEFSFSKSYAPELQSGSEGKSEIVDIPVQNNPASNSGILDPGTAEIEPEEMDFFSWLEHPVPPQAENESEIQPEGESEIEEEKSEETTSHDMRGVDLIERFIATNPQISRPKKEFYSPENMAKRSEVIDLEYVTETLANLYYEQGNLDLAVKAYEKLILQNPLKESYFASLIEKIKKEKK